MIASCLLCSMRKGDDYKFYEAERVKGKKRIDALFSKGEAFLTYPFRVSYLLYESENNGASVLISIPKKRIKSAVKRNRMKRLTREAYRLNKNLLKLDFLPENYQIDIAFIYVKEELAVFEDVQQAVCKALNKINRVLEAKKE